MLTGTELTGDKKIIPSGFYSFVPTSHPSCLLHSWFDSTNVIRDLSCTTQIRNTHWDIRTYLKHMFCVEIRNFLWSVFSRIRNEYGEIPRIFPYLVRMQENTDQKKSVFGNFSRSVK